MTRTPPRVHPSVHQGCCEPERARPVDCGVAKVTGWSDVDAPEAEGDAAVPPGAPAEGFAVPVGLAVADALADADELTVGEALAVAEGAGVTSTV